MQSWVEMLLLCFLPSQHLCPELGAQLAWTRGLLLQLVFHFLSVGNRHLGWGQHFG